MLNPLPYKDFRWASQEFIDNYDFKSYDIEETTGFILEVDLEYPEHLHEKHNSFPLAFEHVEITEKHLSENMLDTLKILGQKNYKEKKLTATFNERKNYVLHGALLALFLELGLKLCKVHRVLLFTQKPFLRDFILKCADLRTAAKTKFEKDLIKKKANSVYGKFLEQIQNRMKAKVCRRAEDVRKTACLPGFLDIKIISHNLSLAYYKPEKIKNTRNPIVGFAILDLAKAYMYHAFYNVLRKKLKNCELLFSDTDSLLVKFESAEKCLSDDIKKINFMIDTSNYNENHPLYDASRKGKLGLFKLEHPNSDIVSFCGLKSKTYTIKFKRNNEYEIKKTCKGIQKNAVKKIKFETFTSCLQETCKIKVPMYYLESKYEHVELRMRKKVAFSSFDGKRKILNCNVHTKPFINEDKNSFCQICNK